MLNKTPHSLKMNAMVGEVGKADKLCNMNILPWHLRRVSALETSLLWSRKENFMNRFNRVISITYLALWGIITFKDHLALFLQTSYKKTQTSYMSVIKQAVFWSI